MATATRKYLGDVVDVKSGHGFDLARLEQWMHAQVPG